MDKMTQNVREFHEAFGIVNRDEPAFPIISDTDAFERGQLVSYATQLANMAKRLKHDAAMANQINKPGLAQILVRLQLHVEETGELAQAIADNDLVEALDALGDMDYVTAGTYSVFGLHELREGAHDVIHASNMSKFGEDGKPIVDGSGRVVKGPNYVTPEAGLKKLLGITE